MVKIFREYPSKRENIAISAFEDDGKKFVVWKVFNKRKGFNRFEYHVSTLDDWNESYRLSRFLWATD